MFTPSRLVLARKRRRMTLANLAAASNVSDRSITAYENGRKKPTGVTVDALAEALDFPHEFFHRPPVMAIEKQQVSFRALSKMSALDRDAALASLEISTIINEWNEQHFRLPEPNVPSLPHLDPEDAAERVRAQWGLAEAPVHNLIHLLEANGVRVFSLAADCSAVDAFSIWNDGRPFITLSTRKTPERSRFDAAHELGHLILHGQSDTGHGPDFENQANAFASAFLMPRAGILAQQLYEATPQRIIKAKRKWRVSAMALTYRLHSLKLLTEWKYKMTAKHLARLGYRNSEPEGMRARESSQLLTKVFAALREDGDLATFADELALTTDELNNHVFGLVPLALDGGCEFSPPAKPTLHLVS